MTLRREGGPAIAYDVAGDGPPVVFVHGLTNRRQEWDPVSQLLAHRQLAVTGDTLACKRPASIVIHDCYA